jgi:phosphate transport system permease protein
MNIAVKHSNNPENQKIHSIPFIKIVFFGLAVIPLIIFILIIINLTSGSVTAVTNVGFSKLFSPQFSGIYGSGKSLFGLLPALWGTFLVVLIAMLIAFPVSLTLAIVSSDFSFGFVSQIIRGFIGLISGIPPIVYALMSTTIAAVFIIPKFCGAGIPADQMPPPGMTWWNPTTLPYDKSVLLGGILLALLIIPFMTPLMDDAITNVPHSLKEASLSLGATRWHTLTNVTLPGAIAGISGATTLGALKAMGDVIIVGWVIGFESGLPNPLVDIFEKTAPLTSTGAGLAGGFTGSGAHNPTQLSVANFTGLLLLVMALVILGLSAYLQMKLRKRFTL